MDPLLLLARVAANVYDDRMKRMNQIQQDFEKFHISLRADGRLYIRVASKGGERDSLLLEEIRGDQKNSIAQYLSKVSKVTMIFINERLTFELNHKF